MRLPPTTFCLNGLIAKHKGQGAVQIVGDFLTYEPYGLMFRKDDPQMAAAVTQAFAAMAADGELIATYRAWFLQPDADRRSAQPADVSAACLKPFVRWARTVSEHLAPLPCSRGR